MEFKRKKQNKTKGNKIKTMQYKISVDEIIKKQYII